MNILNYFDIGGPIMWLLLICSIVSLTVFLERFIFLLKTTKGIKEVSKEINIKQYSDLLLIPDTMKKFKKNIYARLIDKIVQEGNNDIDDMKEFAIVEANKEIPQLEKYITMLGVIYTVAPMLGLLGTVLGLVDSIQSIVSISGGNFEPTALLNGIYKALFTTIFGLIVAIPTHIGYTYLINKVNRIVNELELRTFSFITELKKVI
jgi:biopolymer transport protein ExbB